MSEMFIPSSVWEKSGDYTYGVFELIEAQTIYEMMNDIFSHKICMDNNYFVDPFSLKM